MLARRSRDGGDQVVDLGLATVQLQISTASASSG